MKTFFAVVMWVILMGVMAVASNDFAVAGPHGHGRHHGFHHRGYWGYGPGVIVGGSTVVANEECSMVKRCYIDEFGKRRCRWEQVCD